MQARARRLPAGAAAISCVPPPPQTKAGRRGLACCVHTNMEARLAPREPAHAQRRQPDVTACFAPSFPGMPPSSRHPSCACVSQLRSSPLLAPRFDPWNAAAARLCMFDFLGVQAHSATAALPRVPRRTGRLAAVQARLLCVFVCFVLLLQPLAVPSILSVRPRRSPPAGRLYGRGSEGGFLAFCFSRRATPSTSSSLARPHDLFRGRSERSRCCCCGAWKTTPTAPRLREPFLACSRKSLRDALVSERRRSSVCASSTASWFLPQLWPEKKK